MIKVLHLIDSNNLACIGAYGSKAKHDYGVAIVDGKWTTLSAPVGGVKYLLKRLEQIDLLFPGCENDIVYCFDAHPIIKRQQYPEYKANRDTAITPEKKKINVPAQLKYAQELLQEYDYTVCSIDGYEADDCIYSLWKTLKKEYDVVAIHTTDRDLSFMIDSDTVIINGNKDCWPVTVEEYEVFAKCKYNFKILDKVLAGDNSDNIGGIGNIWRATVENAVADLGYSPLQTGDIACCRRVLIRAAEINGCFPVAEALDKLNVLTPELIDVSSCERALAITVPRHLDSHYFSTTQPERDNTKRDFHIFSRFVETLKK